MKKVFFLLVSLLISLSSLALDVSPLTYSFNEQKNPEDYQQYVGQQFFIRPAYGKLETWEKSGFKPSEETQNMTFTVTKVTVKDVELNKKPNKEIAIEAVQVDGKKKIKFKAYEEVSVKVGFWGDIKQWPLIGYMPVVFTEPFNEFVNSKIGTDISKKEVKDTYKITNVYFGKGESTGEVCYEVQNNRTGEKRT